jgi:hypothetical protein
VSFLIFLFAGGESVCLCLFQDYLLFELKIMGVTVYTCNVPDGSLNVSESSAHKQFEHSPKSGIRFCPIDFPINIGIGVVVILFVLFIAAIFPSNLSAQYDGSQTNLLTPYTNDLDGISGSRAILPQKKEVVEPDYGYKDYGYNPDRSAPNRSTRNANNANNNNQTNTQNNYNPDSQNNYLRLIDRNPQNQQNRNFADDQNPNPNAVRTARLNSQSLDTMNRRSDGRNNFDNNFYDGEDGGDEYYSDEFSSNRVVPFGVEKSASRVRLADEGRELSGGLRGVGGCVGCRLDLSPSFRDDLPYFRVCGYVVVQADFPLKEVELVLLEIENLQRDLNQYLGLPLPKEKVELCLFSSDAAYMKFLEKRFANAPRDRRALYIKKTNSAGTVLVQRTREFETDLRHEMTHAIVHATIPVVPIWLDEGLAKYFEVIAQDRFQGNPYMKQVRRNMRFGTFAVPSLYRLEKLRVVSEMGDAEYRDSWACVHFMFHHSVKTHQMLAGYLKLLANLPQEKYKDKEGNINVPNISLYLEDYVENPRQLFRKHFQK